MMDDVIVEVTQPIDVGDGQSVSHIFISRVLCFIHHHMQNCAPEHVRLVALNYFSNDDILSAKKLLWSSYVKDKLKPYQERRSSTTRTTTEANLNDLIEALKDLDQKGHFIKCSVSNIHDFPSLSPERLNTVAMLKRIESLENMYKDIEDSVNKTTIDMCGVQDSARKHGTQLTEVQNTLDTYGALIESLRDDPDVQEGGQPSEGESSESDGVAIIEGQDENEDGPASLEDSDTEAIESTPDEEEDAVVETAQGNAPAITPAAAPVSAPAARSVPAGGSQIPESRGQRMTQPIRKTVMKAASYAAITRTTNMNNNNRVLSVAKNNTQRFGNPVRKHADTKRLLSAYRKPRYDPDGFVTPRQHFRKQQRQSAMKKIFIGNVDKRHCVEDVLDFLCDKNITVNGLFQRSHFSAAKKSFVCFMNDYNFRQLCKDKECEEFEIREYVDSAVQAH